MRSAGWIMSLALLSASHIVLEQDWTSRSYIKHGQWRRIYMQLPKNMTLQESQEKPSLRNKNI
jgi:hypothetical protein